MTMGCGPSKFYNEHSQNKDHSYRSADKCDRNSTDYSAECSDQKLMDRYDDEIINDIRKDLNENPEIFVLNNVLMATFFMGNYKQEITDAMETRLMNPQNFIEPDSVIERANKNVIYRPLYGPKQDLGEALITKRIYVPVNHSIEVVQDFKVAGENGESKWAENGKFRVKMEDSSGKGYVKLREFNASSIPFDDISQIESLNICSTISSGSSDTDTFSDTTSAYSSMSDLRIPKPIIDSERNEDYSLNDCFVYRKIKKPDADIDLEDLDADNLTDEDVYDVVSYLSSTHFMKYFQRQVFHKSIGNMLGIGDFEINNAKWLPGKFFCNSIDVNGNNSLCEILPCLRISWPEQFTFEFLNQERNSIWPTERMLQEIKRLECVLVPKGPIRKRSHSATPKDMQLEWEIHFPNAEKYMDTFLSRPQMKCFLILLTLHREYIDPLTKQDGLLAEHIRNHIYFECEGDYLGWPEHRLGYKLVSVMYNLSVSLSKRKLKDFFIRKKNLLKNNSQKYLLPASEIFYRLCESPLMLTIRALRNIRNKSGRFYPPLDFKELIRILKIPEGCELNNPNNAVTEESVHYIKKTKPSIFQDAEKQLQYVKMKEKKQKMLEKLKKKHETENPKNLRKKYYNFDVKDNANGELDDEWQCEKCFDLHKKIALLKLFIQCFIDIAKVTSRLDSNKRTLFYLKQAYYLTKILDEESAAIHEDIENFYRIIKREEEKCLKEYDVFSLDSQHRGSTHSLGHPNLAKRLSSEHAKSVPSLNLGDNHAKNLSKADRKLKNTIISEKLSVSEIVHSENSSAKKFSYSRTIVHH